ncbi:MAG: hypothetical protein BRD55_05075 [Bacteroidetes bacterium SW_9_63_38]|nr:MAG: hypothetical protein BRD55_05075 [Bacteroidetes bacterium SW_9_63_38]
MQSLRFRERCRRRSTWEEIRGDGTPIRATAELKHDGGTVRVHHRLAHAETDETLALAVTTWE